jgi:hypothetical protein
VFNALRPDELLVGVGGVLRLVAAAPGPLEEYERSQALSAYSVTRLLAAEERAAAGLLSDTKHALVDAILRSAMPSRRCWRCSPPTSRCGPGRIASWRR